MYFVLAVLTCDCSLVLSAWDVLRQPRRRKRRWLKSRQANQATTQRQYRYVSMYVGHCWSHWVPDWLVPFGALLVPSVRGWQEEAVRVWFWWECHFGDLAPFGKDFGKSILTHDPSYPLYSCPFSDSQVQPVQVNRLPNPNPAPTFICKQAKPRISKVSSCEGQKG